MNVTLIHNFVIQFYFFNLCDSGILTQFGHIFRTKINSCTHKFKIEPPILGCHIPLMEKEYEFQFFDLDTTLEPKLTLEPNVDFHELVLVPEPFISEPKSSIRQNHILLLDQGIYHNDSVMVFQDWSYKGNDFHDRITHDPIHIGDCKYVNRKKII